MTHAPTVHLIAGTRPEAIKIAPVVRAIRDLGRLQPVLVASGQHPQMVAQAMKSAGLEADVVLGTQRRVGSQSELVAQLAVLLDQHLDERAANAVLVQGDTTTTLMGALAAFWRKVPVVHLEAGLRSGDLSAPFPEEANRRMVSQIARVHLAPTALAAGRLVAEGFAPDSIVITGNTVVDAITETLTRAVQPVDPAIRQVLDSGRRVVLVTAHRRENWGDPLGEVLRAVQELVRSFQDVAVILPAHPNPIVREQVHATLGATPRVLVTEPLDYSTLALVLSRSTLVLSDSGGIQEEAPSLRVPVLVLREVTERPEAVQAGCAVLVGTRQDTIVREATHLLTDEPARVSMTAHGNPFGDGRASQRVEQAIAWVLGLGQRPQDMPALPGPDPARRVRSGPLGDQTREAAGVDEAV